MKSIIPSRTVDGYRQQLQHKKPVSNFDYNRYRIIGYVGKSWRTTSLPDWSNFDSLSLIGSFTDIDSGATICHVSGKINNRVTLLKCVEK